MRLPTVFLIHENRKLRSVLSIVRAHKNELPEIKHDNKIVIITHFNYLIK